MIAVVGTPRSGTSTTMTACTRLVGGENIQGSKFPQETKVRTPIEDYFKGEYVSKNPYGFWEDPQLVMQGFIYHPSKNSLLDKLKTSNKVVKIIGRGLLRTPPNYIDKLVFVLREPSKVSDSQKRSEIQGHNGVTQLQDYVAIARWLQVNKVPTLLLNYENFEYHAQDDLADFLGVPRQPSVFDSSRGNSAERTEDELTNLVYKVYSLCQRSKWDEVVALADAPAYYLTRRNKRFKCPRVGSQVDYDRCKACKTDPKVLVQLKKTSTHRKIDYLKEPCSYDCGMGLEKPISIEESIKNNHWR